MIVKIYSVAGLGRSGTVTGGPRKVLEVLAFIILVLILPPTPAFNDLGGVLWYTYLAIFDSKICPVCNPFPQVLLSSPCRAPISKSFVGQ